MIIFNKVTWYSKLAALILFILIVPALTFYIGVQYQKTIDVQEKASKVTLDQSDSAYQLNKNVSTKFTNSTDNKSKDLTFKQEEKTLVVYRNQIATQSILFSDSFIELQNDPFYIDNQDGFIITDEDINFDNNPDLAILSGHNGGYGSRTHDIYLYDPSKDIFVLSDSFTQLASENLGMFDVDTENKEITTFTKSGCCMHWFYKYIVVDNELVLIYETEQDAVSIGGKVKITEKTLVDGKWQIKETLEDRVE